MIYPELNLEDALNNGAPIVMIWEANHMTKGWLYKSKGEPILFIFETEKGQLHHLQKEEIKDFARMWVEPVVFEHWDIIDERIKSISFVQVSRTIDSCSYIECGVWVGYFDDDKNGSINLARVLSENAFPNCSIGTVIKRPEVTA